MAVHHWQWKYVSCNKQQKCISCQLLYLVNFVPIHPFKWNFNIYKLNLKNTNIKEQLACMSATYVFFSINIINIFMVEFSRSNEHKIFLKNSTQNTNIKEHPAALYIVTNIPQVNTQPPKVWVLTSNTCIFLTAIWAED